MKAVTLTQPWAQLVAIGGKKIETRSWNTNYRGPLAIHAAAGKYVDDYLLMKIEPFYSALRKAGIESRMQIPLGGIVATCELIATHRVDEMDWIPGKRGWSKGSYFWEASEQEKAFGDYSIGRYMWFLANIQLLPEPIPAKGALGLWEFNGDLSVYSSFGYDMNEVE
jgi:ASCH domain.